MGPHRDPPPANVLAPGFAIDPLSLWRFLVRSRIRTSLRGQPAGSAGAARGALERLEISRLSGLGTERSFSNWLTEATGEVQASLPSGSFGWARKCLNMVLRDAVYNTYLRETWRLERLEAWAELPLDGEVADFLRTYDSSLPTPFTVARVAPDEHARYQAAAAKVAESRGVARIHLDVLIWGNPERGADGA